MRAGISKKLNRVAPGLLVALVVAGFAAWVVWWASAAETRSVDRSLDIAGQTLVEEIHAGLGEVRRDASALARYLEDQPPWGPSVFSAMVSSRFDVEGSVAYVARTPEGLIVQSSSDEAWLSPGASVTEVGGWGSDVGARLRAPDTAFVPPVAGDSRLTLVEPVGTPGVGPWSGTVVVAVSVDDLLAASTVTGSDGPEVSVVELSSVDAITTSESLVHKEYLLVGDRIWQVQVTPAPGTAYALDLSTARMLAVIGGLLAVAAGGWTHLFVRRRRAKQDLDISTGLSHEKDRFLLALSHQIRTPLTAVVGFLDLLRSHDDIGPEEHDEFLNRAADHADEVAAIVHDILVVTRDDLDLLVVTAAPTNPVKEAMAVAASIPLGEATIEIHPTPAEAPIALADPVRVRQVLRNLVGNAIRHGGTSVHISAHQLAGEVVVTVADDGPGLPEPVADRLRIEGPQSVFDPERSDSLGLGLRVAWLLADRMQGRIEYRRSGTLTMFELILPAPPTKSENHETHRNSSARRTD